MACSLTLLPSCATRTTVVSPSGIVRLGPDVEGHVYTWNADTKQWELSKNKVRLPEGWFATDYHAK